MWQNHMVSPQGLGPKSFLWSHLRLKWSGEVETCLTFLGSDSMSEKNLWEKYVTVDASIRALPQELQDLLNRHEGALLCTEWLKRKHPLESLRNTSGEAVFHWDMVGMGFAGRGGLHEA